MKRLLSFLLTFTLVSPLAAQYAQPTPWVPAQSVPTAD